MNTSPYQILNQHQLTLFVQKRDWKGFWDHLTLVLMFCDDENVSNKLPGILAQHIDSQDTPPEAQAFLDSLSHILLTGFTHHEIQIDDDVFYNLILKHTIIHKILALAGRASTDDAIEQILQSEKRLSDHKQKQILLLLAPDTQLKLKDVLNKVFVKYRGLAILSYLKNATMYHRKIHDNKVALLTEAKVIDSLHCRKELLDALALVYFRVSYLDAPHKHEIKKTLNRYVQKYVKDNKFFQKAIQPRSKPSEKPVLVLFSEFFHKNHAMFRSHSKRIQTYREKFHVILVSTDKQEFDPIIDEICDEFIVLPKDNLQNAIDTFRELGADVIYHLSVGMTIMSILLANCRFAPLQVMALGHPATSYSKEIDFVTGKDDYYTPDSFKTDRYVVEYSALGHKPQIKFKKEDLPIPEDTKPKEELNVMICGMASKLSAPFFDVVSEVTKELSASVNVTVVTSLKDIDFIFMRDYLSAKFENVTLMGYQEYDAYFDLLYSADIILNPFPFGHCHTMTDALLAGKPVVSLKGGEPHSRTEHHFLKLFGLDKQFSCESQDEYREKFMQLSQEILNGKRFFFDPHDVYEAAFEEEKPYNYCDLMDWLYRNHGRLKASKEKYIIPDFYEKKAA